MSTLTGVTLCSGGGGSALGLQAAGVQVVGAVEYDAAIAAHYAAQLGPHITAALVQDVAYRQWAGVDVLQASPPCPNFSNAKQGGVETDTDLSIARAIVRAIREIRPRVFWLENVEGYANSQSYGLIRAALDDLDYWSHAAVVNSADYGVPQTRRRLILRAVSGGWMQPFRPLPAPVPWVGWYAAIADLLDTLPASEFAPWQLQRLPADLRSLGVLVDSKNVNQEYGKLHRLGEEPAITVVTDHKQSHMPRAFLVDDMNARTEAKGGLNLLPAHEPAMSVPTSGKGAYRAFIVEGNTPTTRAPLVRQAGEPIWTVRADSNKGQARAWLDCGRVVKMTPRALARFQAFPDSYDLPSNNQLTCRVLGNAVPPLLSQRITESLLLAEARAA